MGQRFKQPVSVLVVIHTTAGEVLLLDRKDDPAFRQSVTGSLEAGETPAEAAQRELREETGIDAMPTDRQEQNTFEIRGKWLARYAPGTTQNIEHVFSICLEQAVDVVLDPTEHVAYEWLPAADALKVVRSGTNRAAIARICGVSIDVSDNDSPAGPAR